MKYSWIIPAVAGVLILIVLLGQGPAGTRDGEVEAFKADGGKVELSGWALDARAGTPASSIFVTVNGRVVAQEKPSETRRAGSFPTGFRIAFDERVVGNRSAYVASFRGGYPGLVYFVADLNPAPYTIELHTMVFTTQQRRAYMATLAKDVLPHTQAVLTSSLSGREAQIFLHRYPHARRITVMYAGAPYYVLLAN